MFNQRAVGMPRGMSEDGHRHGQPYEAYGCPYHSHNNDEQRPQGQRCRVSLDGPEAGRVGSNRVDATVGHHRQRDHAKAIDERG